MNFDMFMSKFIKHYKALQKGLSKKGLSKKATCLRGLVAEWPRGCVAEINFG